MRKLAIAFATAAVVLALSGLRAADLWRWRTETLSDAERRASNLSRLLAEYLAETFAAGDAALRQLALHSIRVGGPAAPESEWAAPLDAAKASLAGIGSISVTDRDGIIRHSTERLIVGQSRADDYVFRRLRDSGTDDIALDTPFLSRRTPTRYLIPLGRRIVDEHGAFAGAVVATFIPDELRPFFRAVGTGQRGAVWLFHPDGAVLFREPAGNAIGSPAIGNPLFEAAANGAIEGTVSAFADADGAARIGGFRAMQRPPLVVAVSLDRKEVLGEWRRVALGSLSFFLVACTLFAGALVVLFRQMDAKARAEAALREAQRLETERLQEANRLLTASLEREQGARVEAEAANALKDQFLMTVSHELRTPLTAIYGWARMLVNGTVRAPQRDAAIHTIERNARAQMRIIDDLLDAARVMNGKLRLDLQPVDAASVVRDAIETVRPAATAKELTLDAALESPCAMLADGDRLQQVVWNLLSNAVKFTPSGGVVTVALRRDGQDVEIVVGDTGAGISPEFLPHVFERFRQQDGGTKRRHGGLGLGLAIVRSLVELHGGTVAVGSAGPGHGATFTVRLPLRTPGAAASRKDAAGAEDVRIGPRLAGVRVLIVDDDAEARAVFGTVLEDAGAEVIRAASVSEALARFAHEPCDVLLSDIEMPDEDGYKLVAETIALAAKLGRPLATIAVTAYSRPEDHARSLAAGFDGHLCKPVDPVALVAAIDELRPHTVH